MRLAPLISLVAIDDHGSFTAAASAIHLSHSAVSIQIRQLEEEIGSLLFDRSTRPPKLTPFGRDYVLKAREVIAKLDDLTALSAKDRVEGKVAFGFVPTTLQTILPMILRKLGQQFPELQVTACSGPSSSLAASVADGTLDFAFLTAPSQPAESLVIDDIAQERLFVIAPSDTPDGMDAVELLLHNPYIAFSSESWLGQQIIANLSALDIPINPVIELDSINAVEHLVTQGFGVSIVPQRLFAGDLADRMLCLPFGPKENSRRLVLASHSHSNRITIRRTMLGFLQA